MSSVLFRRFFVSIAIILGVGLLAFWALNRFVSWPAALSLCLAWGAAVIVLWAVVRLLLSPIRILCEMSAEFLRSGGIADLRLVMEKGDLGQLCAAFFRMATRVESDGRKLAQCQSEIAQSVRDREKARERAYDLSVSHEKISDELSTYRKRESDIQKATERYEAMLQNIEEYFYEADLLGNLVFFNDAMNRMLGYSHEELYGMNFSEILDPDSGEKASEAFRKARESGRTEKAYEWRMVCKNGDQVYIEISVTPMRDDQGEIIGFRGVGRDITELIYLVYHDSLTGLLNRKAFFERLKDTLAIARRDNNVKHIFYLDLDRFKQVNDEYGHDVGDAVLKEVAERLRLALRETDHICRLGGDEFTIILNNMHGNAMPEEVARRIIASLSRPYTVKDIRIDFISPSIGISAYPGDADSAEQLIRCADTAMDAAKKRRGDFVIYRPDLEG